MSRGGKRSGSGPKSKVSIKASESAGQAKRTKHIAWWEQHCQSTPTAPQITPKLPSNTSSSESKGSVGRIFDLYDCPSSRKILIPNGLQNSKRPPPHKFRALRELPSTLAVASSIDRSPEVWRRTTNFRMRLMGIRTLQVLMTMRTTILIV